MSNDTNEDAAALCADYQMDTYARTATIVKGRGSRVFAPNGNQFLDFTSGISVVALGHAHPAVVEAVKAQDDAKDSTTGMWHSQVRDLDVAAFLNRHPQMLCIQRKRFACGCCRSCPASG